MIVVPWLVTLSKQVSPVAAQFGVAVVPAATVVVVVVVRVQENPATSSHAQVPQFVLKGPQ